MSAGPEADEAEDEDDEGIEAGELLFLVRFLRPFFAPYRRAGLILTGVLLAETVFNIGFPLATRHLVDEGLLRRDTRALVSTLTFLAVAAVAVAVLGVVCDFLAARIASGMVADIRQGLFAHLQSLPLEFFPRTRSGAILSRFSGDVVGLEAAFVALIPWLVLPALEVGYAAALMLWFNLRLGLLGLLAFPLILWLPRLFASRALALGHDKRRSEATLLSVVQENLGAQAVVKAFGLERHALDRLAGHGRQWLGLARGFHLSSFLVERSANTGVYVLHLLIFGLGAYWVYTDRLSLGTFVAFEGLFLSMGEALTYLTQFVPTLAQAAGGARHIREILAEKPGPDDLGDRSIVPRLAREITFESVGFAYPEGLFRLRDFRLRIPKGGHVAIVGASGSGKSTILSLLLRFQDPTEGSILIDGRDLRGVSWASWRAQIGVVFQESILFHASILENIRLGNPDASMAEIEAAARAAEIHDFIVALPLGYETTVGERGGQLSGGQRQRIAIARALVRDPAILILDEATSALDYTTEGEILGSLRNVARGRTLIQVTHRIANVIDADRILLMRDGEVVEEGSHEDLLRLEGSYTDLLKHSKRMGSR